MSEKLYKDSEFYIKIKLLEKSLRTARIYRLVTARDIRKAINLAVRKVRFTKRINKAVPVLVYQMGKVGSMSIVDSLKTDYPGVVMHKHVMRTDDWFDQYVLEWVRAGRHLKIISPVRDPIGRNVSAFFHFIDGRLRHAADKSALPVADLVDLFIRNPDPNEPPDNKMIMDHSMPLGWFDENIYKHFGIDVYATPFPDRGYDRYTAGNIDLLVLRIDVADDVKEQIIGEFLGMPSFKLMNTNIGSLKKYASKYKEFTENAVLPDDYVSEMCQSKYIRHFYREDEIKRIKQKWTGNRNKSHLQSSVAEV